MARSWTTMLCFRNSRIPRLRRRSKEGKAGFKYKNEGRIRGAAALSHLSIRTAWHHWAHWQSLRVKQAKFVIPLSIFNFYSNRSPFRLNDAFYNGDNCMLGIHIFFILSLTCLSRIQLLLILKMKILLCNLSFREISYILLRIIYINFIFV